MKATIFVVISLTAVAAIITCIGPAYGQPSNETAPIFVRNISPGCFQIGWAFPPATSEDLGY
jgi:hypothetical protein